VSRGCYVCAEKFAPIGRPQRDACPIKKSNQKIAQAALLVIEDRSVLQKHPGKHNGTVRMLATY
jgi:hypothetical protein